MNNVDSAKVLMDAAGTFGREILERYRQEQPEMFMGLAGLFAHGYAEFDLTVRSVTGSAPVLELYVRTNKGSDLVASQQLTRRDARPAAWLN